MLTISQDPENPSQLTVPGMSIVVSRETSISDVNICRYSTLKFNFSSLVLKYPADTLPDQPEENVVHYSFEAIRYLSHKELKKHLLADYS